MTDALKQMEEETEAVIKALVELDASKKLGGGVHGQVVGMEPYIIRTNGFGVGCLYDAVHLITKQAQQISGLKAEREADKERLDKIVKMFIEYESSMGDGDHVDGMLEYAELSEFINAIAQQKGNHG